MDLPLVADKLLLWFHTNELGRSVGTLTGGATWRVFHSWLESFMEWVFGSIIDRGVAMFPGGDGALLS